MCTRCVCREMCVCKCVRLCAVELALLITELVHQLLELGLVANFLVQNLQTKHVTGQDKTQHETAALALPWMCNEASNVVCDVTLNADEGLRVVQTYSECCAG